MDTFPLINFILRLCKITTVRIEHTHMRISRDKANPETILPQPVVLFFFFSQSAANLDGRICIYQMSGSNGGSMRCNICGCRRPTDVVSTAPYLSGSECNRNPHRDELNTIPYSRRLSGNTIFGRISVKLVVGFRKAVTAHLEATLTAVAQMRLD